MWQHLLVAAAAASTGGLVAKYMRSPGAQISEGDENAKETNPFDDGVNYQSHVVAGEFNASGYETKCEIQDGIFRFSSPESGGNSGSKNLGNKKKKENVKSEKRSGRGVGLSKRRAVAVCVKKRTDKNVAAKRGSCSSKDSTMLNWGLSIGIMYMMSANKAEIKKLNTAMDEVAKVVQELKSELYKRKSRRMQVFSSANELIEKSEKTSNEQTEQEHNWSRIGNRDHDDQQVLGFPLVGDGDCTSSVLTDERVELDQLEAELECELQKLPWYATESSCHEDTQLELHETNVSTMGIAELDRQSSHHSHGVPPCILDQKLSRLLIEQQENQIVDLESELLSAQSKLCEKESELQALKDCVKRLTEFSLSSIPGDATEAQEKEEDCASKRGCSNDAEVAPRPVVGIKRPILSSVL